MSTKSNSSSILETAAMVMKVIVLVLLVVSLFTPWLRFNVSDSEKLSDAVGVTDAEGTVNGLGSVEISNVILENATWKAKITCPSLASLGAIQVILAVVLLAELGIIGFLKSSPKKRTDLEGLERISKIYTWDLIICFLPIIISLVAIGYRKTFALNLNIYALSRAGKFILVTQTTVSNINYSLGIGAILALLAGVIWLVSAVVQGIYISSKTKV